MSIEACGGCGFDNLEVENEPDLEASRAAAASVLPALTANAV